MRPHAISTWILKTALLTLALSGCQQHRSDPVAASPRRAVQGGGMVPAGHPPMTGGQGASMAGHRKPAAPMVDIGDPPRPAQGPDGHTVADLYGKSASLAGKTVAVRGKVVKINKGIMGRNWLHLQDGSGEPARGTHDLPVTSQQEARVGEVVLARGVLGVDRDFGAGYRYAIILEKATLSR